MSDEKETRSSLITFLAILFLFLGITTKMIAPYTIAIVMGGILALLAHPFYRYLCLKTKRPSLSAALVTVSVIILVVGPSLIFAGLAIKQAITVGQWISQIRGLSVDGLLNQLNEWAPIRLFAQDPGEINKLLQEGVQNIGKALSGVLLDLAKGLPDGILQIFLACLACYFFLVDGKKFLAWIYNKIPMDVEIRRKLASSFRDTAISVIWASMAAAGTQALIMLFAFVVLRVPAGFLAAGATFIFAWIPILGSTPVWLAGAVYLFLQGSIIKMILMIVFGVITGIVDNFVRPYVLKGRGEMHPMISLVAIFGGLQMFGVFGVLFGPILAAVVITLLQLWPIVGKRSGLSMVDE
ncbi:MAG: AI-2E family transporter [Oligoflexus sp.]